MRYLLVIAVLGLGIAIYASAGNAEAGSVAAPTSSDSQQKLASVSQLVGGLEARLRENPDDGKGWLLLAQSYEHLNRHDDAIAAYERASALGITDNQLLYRLMTSTTTWGAQQ